MKFIVQFVAQTIAPVVAVGTIVLGSAYLLNNITSTKKEFIVQVQSFKRQKLVSEEDSTINTIPSTSNKKNYFCQWNEKLDQKKEDDKCQLFAIPKHVKTNKNTELSSKKILNNAANITLEDWSIELVNIDSSIKNHYKYLKLRITGHGETANDKFNNINKNIDICNSDENKTIFKLTILFCVNDHVNSKFESWLKRLVIPELQKNREKINHRQLSKLTINNKDNSTSTPS